MAQDRKHGKNEFKKWDTQPRKEETPEEKINRMIEEFRMDVLRSGKLKEHKKHEYFIKPGQRRRMELAEAKMKAKQNQKRRRQGGR